MTHSLRGGKPPDPTADSGAETPTLPLHMEQFVNGEWVESKGAERIEVRNPSCCDSIVGTAGIACPSVLDQAAASSQEAFKHWSGLPARERSEKMQAVAEALESAAESIGYVVAHELGRPLRLAVKEVIGAARQFRYYAHEAVRWRGSVAQSDHVDREVLLLDRPVGVVLTVTPWNNPLFLLSRSLAPALAAGCTVIGKPSSECPLSTLLMARRAYEAGLPPGVLNVVTGPGRETCERLLAHPAVRKGTLTGGGEAGRSFMVTAARHLKPVCLELGGQCPAIVCEDARLQTATDAITFQAFRQGGQVCNRVNRVYAHESIYREFVGMLRTAIGRVRVGLIDDPEADYGALINQQQIDTAGRHVQDAVEKGAVLETGGAQLEQPPFDRGYFFPPTLLSDCTPEMLVMTEETFGPVLGIAPYRDFDSAIEAANDTEYGLAAYLFTSNATRCHRSVRALEAGNIWINDIHLSYPQCPYGGIKGSGVGRTQGVEAMREFLERTTVYWDFADYGRGEYMTGH